MPDFINRPILPRDAEPLQLAAEGASLCTLVSIDGPFSRALGAQFAATPSGARAGDMTGGCLDRALAEECAKARDDGKRRVVRYGQGSPYIDIRLPCGGGLDILIDPAPDRTICAEAVDALGAREPVALALPMSDNAGALHRLPTEAGMRSQPIADGQLFRRVYRPALRLQVFGGGPEATALARLASAYGVAAHSHTPASEEGGGSLYLGRAPGEVPVDPWTAIILLFHDHDWELPILDWALGTNAFFIGALGSQRTADTRRDGLRAMRRSEEDLAKIHGPIGLFGPARDADTLALSVLAELVSRYNALD
jgi:xanthine dehydrogenase accessory factor